MTAAHRAAAADPAARPTPAPSARRWGRRAWPTAPTCARCTGRPTASRGPWRRSCTGWASTAAATRRWPRRFTGRASTPGPTTTAATAARAGRASTSSAGRSSTTTSRRGCTALREANPGRPLVLYGHSLGGLVACGYVLSGQGRPLPDLLVLSAPALDADLPGWKKTLAGLLTGVVPKAADRERAARRRPVARPGGRRPASTRTRCAPSKSTVRWGAEAFKEQDRLRRLLPRARRDAGPDLRPARLLGPDRAAPGDRRVRGQGQRDPRGSTAGCATSATTSRSTRRCWPRWWSGCEATASGPPEVTERPSAGPGRPTGRRSRAGV